MAALTLSDIKTDVIGAKIMMTGKVAALAATGWMNLGMGQVDSCHVQSENAPGATSAIQVVLNSQTATEGANPGYVFLDVEGNATCSFTAIGV